MADSHKETKRKKMMSTIFNLIKQVVNRVTKYDNSWKSTIMQKNNKFRKPKVQRTKTFANFREVKEYSKENLEWWFLWIFSHYNPIETTNYH